MQRSGSCAELVLAVAFTQQCLLPHDTHLPLRRESVLTACGVSYTAPNSAVSLAGAALLPLLCTTLVCALLAVVQP